MLFKIGRKIWQKIYLVVSALWWFPRDFWKFMRNRDRRVPLRFFPKIFDRKPSAHIFDHHYEYMNRWAIEQLLTQRPEQHVDVGSAVAFVSMASLICPTIYVDIRPLVADFSNFTSLAGNVTELPFSANSLSSLSCLHVAEHVGLGRYGDVVDVFGTQKACAELARVLAPGGKLLFALPIGVSQIFFNAHRVLQPSLVISYFAGLTLQSFSVVDDNGRFISSAQPANFEQSRYACGLFVFTKSN